MNDLETYFYANQGRLVHKWRHYFEIYDRHFARFRNKDVHVVEIGVYKGGSLDMWRHYFGSEAKIYGIDVDPSCARFASGHTQVLIGDQGDRGFLRQIAKSIPRIDILIDDGGHTMAQQIATFEELFPHVDPHGVYLCEDLHTSYWGDYGGGLGKSDTFIEYSKSLIDQLNAWHSRDATQLSVSEFTRTAHSMHFYDSVLVIEKRPMEAPSHMMTGYE